jgi:hypothetical protein
MKTVLIALALSWPLIAPALDTLPTGCTVTQTHEDGGAYAILYDPDGQPWANTAGVPIREPGWYPVEEER